MTSKKRHILDIGSGQPKTLCGLFTKIDKSIKLSGNGNPCTCKTCIQTKLRRL